MNDNENPFAYGAENTRTQSGGFHDYDNPFAFQTEASAPAAGKRDVESTYVTYSSHPVRLQRCNAALRLLTFIFCLLAVLLTLLSAQKADSDGIGTKITYSYNGSFKFFLYTNITVALYALVLSVIAFFMFRKRTGETTPGPLLWPLTIFNLIALTFIILAFSTALSIEALNHGGMTLDSTAGGLHISWPTLCSTYKTFCGMIDAALGTSVMGFLTLLASTGIDGYILHRKNV